MAKINAKVNTIHFNPYTDSPNTHFERVTRNIFNSINDDIEYTEYKNMAEDRSVNSVNKKDLKKAKKAVEEDINRIFESKGVDSLKNFLNIAVNLDISVDWEASKESVKEQHKIPNKPEKPNLQDIPPEPSHNDPEFQPDFGLLDYILPYRKREKREKMREAFEEAHAEWEEEKERIESENQRLREQFAQQKEQWESEVEEVKEKRKKAVEAVEQLREDYRSGEKEAVQKVTKEVLEGLPYPTPDAYDKIKRAFEGELETTFKPESNLLIIDRSVPPPEKIPRRKKIKYVKSRDAFKAKDLSKRDFKELYESIPYQVALRTVYEVFRIDRVEVSEGGVPTAFQPENKEAGVIETVVFNGWVTSVNPATGHEETVCTLSLQASRDEIMELNLSQVDPKAAFKNLKGVSASKLRDKSPITPIVQADRSDSRFTEGRDVGEDMKEGENIAAMDWEDFEHLIRELFESEFAKEGGEVKVTQASRDGGIDAVAFDPDPLRGGKIVIQAKRYTQTVGVSAVRDLYGTVMNEGASRGILVTTSDYGSGAYDFAKDKPLQLLDGGNLLSLLEQHGYDARIDVEEARKRMD